MNKQPGTVLTRKGELKLNAELEHLRTVSRHEIAERLKVARAFGDLSENSEYKAAKEEQENIEARIAEIENTLAHATIIDDADISTDKVGIGTIVKLLDMSRNEEVEFHIVGTKEANIKEMKMSDESPVGSAIKNHAVNEEVEVETPSGRVTFKILEIRKEEE